MTLAFAFIECARGLASSARDAVRQVEGVSEAYQLKDNGTYDLVVKIQTENEIKFKDAILTIKNLAGIGAVGVSIVYAASFGQVH